MNKEYQKQTVRRLSLVSDWMISELDIHSENQWENHRKFIFEKVDNALSILATCRPEVVGNFISTVFSIDPWLYSQYNKSLLFSTDPFLPDEIRIQVHDFYADRICKMCDALTKLSEKFCNDLLKGNLKNTNVELKESFWTDLCKEYESSGTDIDASHKRIIEIRENIKNYLRRLD